MTKYQNHPIKDKNKTKICYRNFNTQLGKRLKKEMAPHSRILAWRIPRTEEPDKLQSIGSQESDTA